MTTLPTVAIVGRPNVGKSTLMNRVLGRREAIVEERPGVTRDRKEVVADWQGRFFVLVDTGGWSLAGDALDDKVSRQSEHAMYAADVAVLVVDATTGVTSEDDRVADLLRRREGPTLVAVNKVDDQSRESLIWEFMSLGFGDPFPLSALHGRGSGDLLDAIVAALPPGEGEEPDDEWIGDDDVGSLGDDEDEDLISVAIVGRPNVGKSTLFNRLVGEDRSVVHDMPGTTRDSVDTVIETEVGTVRIVDTAGLRRRSRIDDGTEYYAMTRALSSIDRADIALLVIDATQGVTHQDQRLAERIDVAGCPIIIVMNKWEMLDTDSRPVVERSMERKLHFLGEAPIMRISAISGRGVQRLMPLLSRSVDDYHRRVPTRQVNQVIREAQIAQAAPGGARVLYATQGAIDPPTFTLFANRRLPQTYVRYLERALREAFDLGSTPIKLRVRNRSE
jgi:GTP-binding protein